MGSFDQNRSSCGRRPFIKYFPCPLSLHPIIRSPLTPDYSLKEALRFLEVTCLLRIIQPECGGATGSQVSIIGSEISIHSFNQQTFLEHLLYARHCTVASDDQ